MLVDIHRRPSVCPRCAERPFKWAASSLMLAAILAKEGARLESLGVKAGVVFLSTTTMPIKGLKKKTAVKGQKLSVPMSPNTAIQYRCNSTSGPVKMGLFVLLAFFFVCFLIMLGQVRPP